MSDGSSTSPHLKYAASMDEGGRGLFMVAQLTKRWGTRYLPQGKIIWAEQPLPASVTDPDGNENGTGREFSGPLQVTSHRPEDHVPAPASAALPPTG